MRLKLRDLKDDRTHMKKRPRFFALLSSAVVIAVQVVLPHATRAANAATHPTVVISSPAAGSQSAKPLIMSGTAADDQQVVGVELQIYRPSDATFWNGATSSWSTTYPPFGQRPSATFVSGRNTPSASWTFSFLPPETSGTYSVQAVAFDNDWTFGVSDDRTLSIQGVAGPTSTTPTTVGPTVTTAAPSVTTAAPPAPGAVPTIGVSILAPESGWFGSKPVQMTGVATDDVAVGAVELQINRSDGSYYNGTTGTWTASYPPFGQRPAATITSGRYTQSATWTYAFIPSDPTGTYSIQAIVLDTAGNYSVSPARWYVVNTTGSPSTVPPPAGPTSSEAPTTSPVATTAAPTTAPTGATTTTRAPTTTPPAPTTTAAPATTVLPVVARTIGVTIDSPDSGWFGSKPVVISGTATDNAQVASVELQISRADGMYLNGANGTWSAAYPPWGQRPAASITSGRFTSSAQWTYVFNPSEAAGTYSVQAIVLDNEFNYSTSAFKSYVINTTGVPMTTPPPTTPPTTIPSTATTTTTPTTSTTPPTPPAVPAATGAPLNPNSSVTGTAGWNAFGATYDTSESRGAGGSFKFVNLDDRIQSGIVRVTPNTPYTLSAFIKTSAWPPSNLSIFALEFDASGAFVRLLETSLTNVGPGRPNTWQESATVVLPGDNTNYIAFGANRADQQLGTAPLWLDDLAILPGVGVRVPQPSKTAFSGSQSRIDSLGNWEVLENGSWKPWFPLCVAANGNRSTFDPLAAGGFNCDIWGGADHYGIEKAKAAGMRSFFNISQYYQPNGWAYRNWTDLVNRIGQANASPAADALAGYWMDNEAPFGTFSDYEQTARTIQSTDQLNGVRRRPIVQLMRPNYARSFTNDGVDFSDALASYTPPGASTLPIASVLDGQNQPLTMCQLSGGGTSLRSVIYGCIAQGGRAVSYWMDGVAGQSFGGFPVTPVEQQPWWPDLPAIRSEIDALLPLIRTPLSTSWNITSSTGNAIAPLVWSTRDLGGTAHMILSNQSGAAQQVTFTVQSGAYAVGEVRDYFTNQLITTAQNGTFTLNMAAAGVGTGTRVVKLVPR